MNASDFGGIVLLVIIGVFYFVTEKMIDGKDGIGEIKKVISLITDSINRFVKWVNRF